MPPIAIVSPWHTPQASTFTSTWSSAGSGTSTSTSSSSALGSGILIAFIVATLGLLPFATEFLYGT